MKTLRDINPPEGLEKSILGEIYKREKRGALVRFISTGLVAVASCLGIIPAVIYLVQSISSSGFLQYVSLLSSDGTSLLTYWKEFSMSLAESLPLFSLTISIALLGIFIWSLSKAAKNARTALAF